MGAQLSEISSFESFTSYCCNKLTKDQSGSEMDLRYLSAELAEIFIFENLDLTASMCWKTVKTAKKSICDTSVLIWWTWNASNEKRNDLAGKDIDSWYMKAELADIWTFEQF